MSWQGNANGNREYSSTTVNMYRLLDVDGSGHLKSILNRSKGAYKLLQDVIDCYVGKECYRLTKLNEGCGYCVVRGVCLYREWEFIIDGSHYRVHYDVIHDSLETCNTVRNSKWNAFELVKSSASFKGRVWFVSSVDGNLVIRILSIDGTEEMFVQRFANREGTRISANASPQMVKGAFGPPKETPVSLDWNEVEAIRTFPSAGSSFSCKVLHNRSSIKLKELPVSIRAVMLVPLILASTMAFLNSLAVDKVEKLINDVTETEAVRLEALLYTSAK
ncbi:hypothetical protein D917_00482 [Trichinella nativa]|uniref:Uncharacterized protein n=1 Tax=Trichinella nativa TaxID=6335 RepID=A0A1Y3E7U3_9BILA|nr:hypothetical protein D917_00482 [Trichinella nativa]